MACPLAFQLVQDRSLGPCAQENKIGTWVGESRLLKEAQMNDNLPRQWGYPDLHVLNLLRALELAAETPHGFGRADVEKVESFGEYVDLEYATYGYVVGLRDGRRAYLAISLDDTSPDHKESIAVEPIPQGAPWPPSEGVPALPIWYDDVADVNEQLRG